MYDAIVVGARCAGAPTAMLLARRGYRVLLVDRASFPSDTLSTHYLHPPGVAALQRWGLLERLAASNCPPIRRVLFDVGTVAVTVPPVPAGDIDMAYIPRRIVLDAMLVDAALAAGVELRETFTVREFLTDGERVTGIRGQQRGGPRVTETARIVVGADGLHSRLARAVRAPAYHALPALACYYFAYFAGVAQDRAEFYWRDPRRVLAVFPTHDALALVGVALPHAEFAAFRADVAGNFARALQLVPDLAARVAQGARVGRMRGTADLPNFFRKPYGPGWALVGDAGYHKDPITGWGIADAFRDAELLVDALDAGLSGRQELADALAGYEQARNAAALPIYEFTCRMAVIPSPADAAQLLAPVFAGPPPTPAASV